MIWNILTCVALLWCALLTAWRFFDGLKDFRALTDAVRQLKRPKLKRSSQTQPIQPINSYATLVQDVELALIGQGYGKTVARDAIARTEIAPNMSREELFKAVLNTMRKS